MNVDVNFLKFRQKLCRKKKDNRNPLLVFHLRPIMLIII